MNLNLTIKKISNGFVIQIEGQPEPFYFTNEDEIASFIKKTITKKPKVVRIKREHLEKLAQQPQIN